MKKRTDNDIHKLFQHAQPKARQDFRADLREKVLAQERQYNAERAPRKRSFAWLFAASPALVAVVFLFAVVQFVPTVLHDGDTPSGLLAQTVAASEVGQEVSGTFNARPEDVRYATRTNGDMAILYPSGDSNAFLLHTYVRADDAWNDAQTLSFAQEEILNVSDIQITTLTTGWAISAAPLQQDNTIVSRYVVYVYDAFGEELDVIEQSQNIVTVDTSVLRILPGANNDMHVLWQNGDQLEMGYWNENEGMQQDRYSVNSIASASNIEAVITAGESTTELFIFGRNTAGFLQSAVLHHTPSGYELQFQHTLATSSDAQLLDAQLGNGGEVFLLYQHGDGIFSQRLYHTGEITTAERIFTLQDSDALRINNIQALFNPYGDGQYAVLLRETAAGKTDFRLRYWIPRTEWQEEQRFYSSQGAVNMPKMVGFTSGFIQMLWSDTDLYMKQYVPAERAWSVNHVIPREYADLRLYKPLVTAPPRSIQGTKSLVMFEDRETSALRLKKWHIGTDPAQETTLVFPNEDAYVLHTSNENTYYILTTEGTKLKSYIYQDGQLFQ